MCSSWQLIALSMRTFVLLINSHNDVKWAWELSFFIGSTPYTFSIADLPSGENTLIVSVNVDVSDDCNVSSDLVLTFTV